MAEHLAPAIPRIEADVIDSVDHETTVERRWGNLRDEQSDIVRDALVQAELMRVKEMDAGEGFLRGVDWAYAVLTEQQRRETFAAEMEATFKDDGDGAAPPHAA